ncbi:ABC transporter permease [Streptomyces sp. XD-27]|uniref:ABC transporter permease n=1 Tax=Streptomyces sp. XD-27 TaxID=3062779 RepID=UPI0026F43046|nr:ABC transporter permease [Streptomyces sp. XD-27]WKX71223.1 ABC transporter permease [Streptomyces sp. XD-27]
MSAEVVTVRGMRRASGTAARLRALGRAELTLLRRNKAAMFTALVLPLTFTTAMKSTVDGLNLKEAGLSPETVLLPGTLGFVLLFGIYANLVPAYVVRRDELVLKRLRCGELTDREILAGTALPSLVIALVQCLLVAAGAALVLDVAAPEAPHLALAGVLCGMVMLAALAAATAGVTRSAEGAQLSVMPLLMLSMAGSGLVFPLEVLPDRVASVCEVLPLTPVVGLIRAGWTGASGQTLGQLVTAMVWTGVAVFAVRRWFRWEPRQ